MSAVKPSGVVTLMTDFGTEDPFVGVMKGAVLTAHPEARIVDLTHSIRPQDVQSAAFWMARCFRYFPEGTVHLAVVDPGVGTARRPIVFETARHYFVGPDNGIFGPILAGARAPELRKISASRLGLSKPSTTFHGRDIFAPCAGALSSGERWLPELGPECPDWTPLTLPEPESRGGALHGAVIAIDHFGNLITNLQNRGPCSGVLRVAGLECPIVSTYAEAPDDAPVALVNAFECLEIAVNCGSAAARTGLGIGTEVVLVRAHSD